MKICTWVFVVGTESVEWKRQREHKNIMHELVGQLPRKGWWEIAVVYIHNDEPSIKGFKLQFHFLHSNHRRNPHDDDDAQAATTARFVSISHQQPWRILRGTTPQWIASSPSMSYYEWGNYFKFSFLCLFRITYESAGMVNGCRECFMAVGV